MAHPDDIGLMRDALTWAVNASNDPRTQNGALLLSSCGTYRAFGSNRFPAGVEVRPERLDPAVKLKYMEHAERSAIYAAARVGMLTLGSTLYCPWFACVDCARAIICAGVRRVVGLHKPRRLTPERWQQTIADADELLVEAGIITDLLDDEIGVEILFNGEKVTL